MPITSTRKFFLSLLACSLVLPQFAHAKSASADFEAVLKNIKKSGTHITAQIVNLTNTRNLISVDADEVLNPASSIKLFTAYTALRRLGINFSFKTEIYKNKDASFCVKGGGDPSFVMEDLYLVTEALKRKGVESYSGKIALDASVFDQEQYPEDRESQDSERAYNAPLSGLDFNYNTISVFVNPTTKGSPARMGLDFPFEFVKLQGSVTTGSGTDISMEKKKEDDKGDEVIKLSGKIAEGGDEWHKPLRMRNPSRAFGQAFARMLKNVGIEASGKLSVADGICDGIPIYTYASKPLSYIVQLMDKYSNNFIADSLVKTLDHEVNSHQGTSAGGLKFLREEMKNYGVDFKKGRTFVSGSGLTQGNAMSASDFIKLLQYIHREKLYEPEMFTSLPVAALDGTLKRKYVNSPVAQRLRGKTGTLNGVQSLVGIYPTPQGEWIAIAIVTNGGRGIPENDLAKYLGTL
jgi:D-alanyl-D-alanine carboxypeptidase/D-alanyl-D-alanine-endopeptidase (penicillin-binding protein 4)